MKKSLYILIITVSTFLMLTGCSKENNQTIENNYKHTDNFEKLYVVKENSNISTEEVNKYREELNKEYEDVVGESLEDKVQHQSEITEIEVAELEEIDTTSYSKEYTDIVLEPHYEIFNKSISEYGLSDNWTFGTTITVLEAVCNELNIEYSIVLPNAEYPEEIIDYTVWKFVAGEYNIDIAVHAELNSAKVSITEAQ